MGLALLLPAVPAFAADAPAKTDAAIPDKPTRITERNTPVAVEYEGNDSIGSRLATQKQSAAPEALMLDIAKRHFFVETLDTRNIDGLDFHDVAVWAIRSALVEAHAAGFAAAGGAALDGEERQRDIPI